MSTSEIKSYDVEELKGLQSNWSRQFGRLEKRGDGFEIPGVEKINALRVTAFRYTKKTGISIKVLKRGDNTLVVRTA